MMLHEASDFVPVMFSLNSVQHYYTFNSPQPLR